MTYWGDFEWEDDTTPTEAPAPTTGAPPKSGTGGWACRASPRSGRAG